MEKSLFFSSSGFGKTLFYEDIINNINTNANSLSVFISQQNNITSANSISANLSYTNNFTIGKLLRINDGLFLEYQSATDVNIPNDNTSDSFTSEYVFVSAKNNNNLILHVPYKYSFGYLNTSRNIIPDYYYVNYSQNIYDDNWLFIYNSKFKVGGPFSYFKSDKTAIRDKILTVGYIDKIDDIDDNNDSLNAYRGIDFEYIENGTTNHKLGFMGFRMNDGHFVFYPEATYKTYLSGLFPKDENIILKNIDVMSIIDIDELFVNNINTLNNLVININGEIIILTNNSIYTTSLSTTIGKSTNYFNAGYFNKLFINELGNGFSANNFPITNFNLNSGTIDNAIIGSTIASSANFTTLNVSNTTDSTSISTGALIVSGGVGITKNLYVGGTADFNNAIMDKATIDSGTIDNTIIGSTIASSANFTTLNVSNTTDSTSISTGALIVSGGAGITKNLYVGGTIKTTNLIVNTVPSGIVNNLVLGYSTLIDTSTFTNSTIMVTSGSLYVTTYLPIYYNNIEYWIPLLSSNPKL
jgi:hypothetical protein